MTSLLRELRIPGREKALGLEPELHLYRAARVLTATIDCEDETAPRLLLKLAYEADGKRYALGLLFEGIRELVLPDSGSGGLFLPVLEIDDVRERMMEGIRFEATSELSFRCSCANISVAPFEPL